MPLWFKLDATLKATIQTHVQHELNSHLRALFFSVVPNNINYWRGPSHNESKGAFDWHYSGIRINRITARFFFEDKFWKIYPWYFDQKRCWNYPLNPDSIKILLGVIFRSKRSYAYSGIRSIERALREKCTTFQYLINFWSSSRARPFSYEPNPMAVLMYALLQ